MLHEKTSDVSIKTRRKQRSSFASLFLFVFFTFLEHVRDTAFATIVAIVMGSHEHTRTTLLRRAFTTKTTNLAGVFHLKEHRTDPSLAEQFVVERYFVVFQDGQFDFLVLVFVLLRCIVRFLLALLATTFKIEQNVQGTFLFDVALGEG